MTDFASLRLLLGGYLHEDFDDEFGDSWGAVEAFAQNEPEDPPHIREDITRLLATVSSEEEVRRLVLDEFGSYYLAEVDGWTYRGWLEAVADRVDQALRSRGI
jgi:contact-dependent growth inhibition (CDI) system CdiI-like immunity protein